ncbi:MAG: alanine racemase [Eubacteriales bacterium]|nr:alanine racemase [Eubacteriales bacterium]
MEFQNKNRTWAEIDLGKLAQNFRNIRAHVHAIQPETKVLGVVKADAYGHGAVPAATVLEQQGADFLAVATAQEAKELRDAGIKAPILVLGYVDAAEIPEMMALDVAVALCDRETAEVFSAAAQQTNGSLRVHIALDTGMTRIGFEADDRDETIEEILSAVSLPHIQAEGIFTHFAVADMEDGDDYTQEQFTHFRAVCEALDRHGLSLTYRHCANSGAILQHPETFAMTLPDGKPVFTMVRAGIILYGYYPDATTKKTVELHPVMTVKAHVVQVRETPADVTVSYGRTYCTGKPTKIAVVTMGYEDGYHRAGSGQAVMLVQDKVVPVIGRICMDMCMLDVTGLDVRRGDLVTVFGEGPVNADTVAAAAGTISYEVLCAISKRIPRFYV